MKMLTVPVKAEQTIEKCKKKVFSLLLTLPLIIAAAGCASGGEADAVPTTVTEAPRTVETEVSEATDTSASASQELQDAQTSVDADDHEKTKSSILVVYFSRTGEQYRVGVIDKGNTAIVAEMIAEQTGADLFEIMPADDHYPMTYDELTEVALTEQNEKSRPEYAGEVPDLSGYSTVFIGAPVWWGDWPMIMYTFFEDNASGLAGKTLIPFSTHEGSGLSGFDRTLASSCPDSEVRQGLAVKGSDCQYDKESVRNDVAAWLKDLGY